MYELSQKSILELVGVHPDLVKVVHHAITITEIDFTVLQGTRTKDEQQKLFEQGKSRTLRSRHVPESNQCFLSCAVDLGAWVGGTVSWDIRYYRSIAAAMFSSAISLGIQIEWGGHWRTFQDGPHFQLPWKFYP